MADMVDSGRYAFQAWARQTPAPATGECFYNRWLGPFDPEMGAAEAYQRLDMEKLQETARALFARGWTAAQTEYKMAAVPAATIPTEGA